MPPGFVYRGLSVKAHGFYTGGKAFWELPEDLQADYAEANEELVGWVVGLFVGWLVCLLVGCSVSDGYIDFPGKSNDLLVFVAQFHPCLLCTLSSTWQRPISPVRPGRGRFEGRCVAWMGQHVEVGMVKIFKVCSCLGMQNNPVG